MEETKIMFIQVNKNIKTKFLIKKDEYNYESPIPGTVVDSEIIKNNRYEFYLVSSKSPIGIATPTHYSVIYDSTSCSPEDL